MSMTHVYMGERSVVCLKGPIVVHVHCMIENVFITAGVLPVLVAALGTSRFLAVHTLPLLKDLLSNLAQTEASCGIVSAMMPVVQLHNSLSYCHVIHGRMS